jgi:hypothetical protein
MHARPPRYGSKFSFLHFKALLALHHMFVAFPGNATPHSTILSQSLSTPMMLAPANQSARLNTRCSCTHCLAADILRWQQDDWRQAPSEGQLQAVPEHRLRHLPEQGQRDCTEGRVHALLQRHEPVQQAAGAACCDVWLLLEGSRWTHRLCCYSENAPCFYWLQPVQQAADALALIGTAHSTYCWRTVLIVAVRSKTHAAATSAHC